MAWIEIRRHSYQGMGKSLSQEGVEFARRVGKTAPSFDLILTSQIQRAQETAIAMGYAIHAQEDFLGFLPEELLRLTSFEAGFAHFHSLIKSRMEFQKWADTYHKYLSACFRDLDQDSNALVISHAGTVEMLIVSLCQSHDFSTWPQAVKQLQGARITLDSHGNFLSPEFLAPD